MSYAVKDRSVQDGAPIECYEFVANHKTWRYTSYHTRIQVDSQWYEPLPITRSTIKITSVIDSNQTMDFNIPSDNELAQHFCFSKTTPKELKVVVRVVHEGDNYATQFKIEWTGRFAGSSGNGKWGIIKTASLIQTELNGNLSTVFYQKTCNHVLFDARCKAVKADYTVSATVVKIQDQLITVNDDGFANNDLVSGMMVNVRTGEQQSIISNVNNLLRIGYTFFDLVVGDIVELTLGCDHQRLGHCKNRFNNVVNYGGFDFIPEVNPFEKLAYNEVTRTEVSGKGEISFKPRVYLASRTTRAPGSVKTNIAVMGYGNSIKKPNRQVTFESSVSENSGNIPAASLGTLVAGVLGKKLVLNHNLIWTGNLRPVTETVTATEVVSEEESRLNNGQFVEKYTTTKTTITTTTVGYLADIMLGLCLGPNVQLKTIFVDKVAVWTGTAGSARTEITIPVGEHFLSGKKVYFSGGAFDQAPDPLIDTTDFPGHVGVATILLKDIRVDSAMGEIGFEVVRIPNPLGLSTGNNRSGDDLNLISALVESMTNEWGYGGLNISNFDTAKFTSMAITAMSEGNVVSVKIDNEVAVTELIAQFQTQGYLVVYENPETGLITGELIRYSSIDYVNMPRFHGRGNAIELRNFQKQGWQQTVEQARALFPERLAMYQDTPVFMQNPANISPSGRGKRTATFNYPFVPLRGLAQTLLGRDLGQISAPIYSFNLVTNRDGASLLPGKIVTVTWEDYGILNLPMLVQSISKQDINNRSVVLDLKQVKFPDTRSLLGPGGAAYDPNFDVDPKTPLGARILSAPYYMVRSGNGISSLQTTPLNYPLILARPANNFQASMSVYLTNAPDSTQPVPLAIGAPYATYALLNGSIGLYDNFDTGKIPSITIDNVVNPNNLKTYSEALVRGGSVFMLINGEILAFENAVNNGDGTWTLSSVHRALLDTVFAAHADNDPVWIIGNNFAAVSDAGFTLPVGYVPSFNIVPNSVTKQGLNSQGLVSTAYSPGTLRTLSPPRPHNTKVNGNTRSSTPINITEGASVTVTWATRSRTSLDVKLMLDAAELGEQNASETQKHYVYHRSAGGLVTNIGSAGGYTGNTATFNMPNVTDGAGFIYVQAEMTLSGFLYTSINQDRIPVNIIP